MSVSYFKDIYPILSNKYPNRNIYLISDHHFYHNNIIKFQRPFFANIEEMHNYIITKHNHTIKNDDIVLFLGDFSFKNQEIPKILKNLNGHKYLLLGNHDSNKIIKNYELLGFEGLFLYPVKFQDKYLSHQPLDNTEELGLFFNLLINEFNQNNNINYHGHLHNNYLDNKKFINVCCETVNYTPLPIGKTGNKTIENKPLFINTKYFDQTLLYLQNNKNYAPSLVVADYIYCTMLEILNQYKDKYIAYGSFPLFKKYNFISNFSDLDIGLFYDKSLSKRKNILLLKQLADTVFENLLPIYNLHLSYYKRIANLNILNTLYTNGKGITYNGFYDSNLVTENVYKTSDFISYTSQTLIEKMLLNNNKDFTKEFHFPKFNTNFLTPTGDIANLVLQVLFQPGLDEKKIITLKKLNFVYRYPKNKEHFNIQTLEDTLIRFYIRNTLFFYYTNRKKEIIPIPEINKNYLINHIAPSLKIILENILNNPQSQFNLVVNELTSTHFEEIPQIGNKLIYPKK